MLTTPWIRRLVAIMLVALMLSAVYILAIEPIVGAYNDTAARLRDTHAQVIHLRRLAALRPGLAAQVDALEQRQDVGGYYLAGGTDALAAVALQDRIKEVVGSGGAAVRSMQPLAGTDEQGFRRVTVRVQLTATTESLFHVLYGLESGRPLVFIDNFDVQNRAEPFPSPNGTNPPLEDPAMVVAFDLYGYLPAVSK